MKGNAPGYFAGCHEEFGGDILAGLVKGGERVTGTEGLGDLMWAMDATMAVTKFEPANWAAVGNNVFFTVDWEFVYKPTGNQVATTAVVRKVIRDGKICEKYHRVNAEA